MQIDIKLEDFLDKYYSKSIPKEFKGIIARYTYNSRDLYLTPLKKIIYLYPERKEEIIKNLDIYDKERIEELDIRKYEDDIIKLDEATRITNLPCELILYRGTSEEYFNQTTLKKDNNYKTLINYSTSIYSEVAMEHIRGCHELMLEIHIDTNNKGLWLSPFSLYPEESEILLPINQTFILEKTEYIFYGDQKVKTYILKSVKE